MKRKEAKAGELKLEFVIGPKGRAVVPAQVRRAAHVSEGDRLIAHAEGPGRIVLESREGIQARVWAAAPEPRGLDAVRDVRALRAEDTSIADANAVRRTRQTVADDAASDRIGAALLEQLGL